MVSWSDGPNYFYTRADGTRVATNYPVDSNGFCAYQAHLNRHEIYLSRPDAYELYAKYLLRQEALSALRRTWRRQNTPLPSSVVIHQRFMPRGREIAR